MRHHAAALATLACVTALTGCGAPLSTESPAAPSLPPVMSEHYRCDQVAFLPEALLQPGTAEGDPDAVAQALRDFLSGPLNDSFMPLTGWHRLGQTAGIAEFATFVEDPAWNSYVSISFEPTGVGWRAIRWGSCEPRRVVQADLVSLVWWLPNGQPEAEARTLTVEVVVDDCKVGPPVGAVLEPSVSMGEDIVVIALTARRFAQAACPDHRPNVAGQPTPLEIELPEEVGRRALADGSVFPGRDATSPPDWYFGVGG